MQFLYALNKVHSYILFYIYIMNIKFIIKIRHSKYTHTFYKTYTNRHFKKYQKSCKLCNCTHELIKNSLTKADEVYLTCSSIRILTNSYIIITILELYIIVKIRSSNKRCNNLINGNLDRFQLPEYD
jgi:hypothetical protein